MVKDTPEGVLLTVYVQPKAARTEYVGIHGQALKFRVAAPPVEGAANEELCRYLAKKYSVPVGSVVIRAGRGARHKQVLLKRVKAQHVLDSLGGGAPS